MLPCPSCNNNPYEAIRYATKDFWEAFMIDQIPCESLPIKSGIIGMSDDEEETVSDEDHDLGSCLALPSSFGSLSDVTSDLKDSNSTGGMCFTATLTVMYDSTSDYSGGEEAEEGPASPLSIADVPSMRVEHSDSFDEQDWPAAPDHRYPISPQHPSEAATFSRAPSSSHRPRHTHTSVSLPPPASPVVSTSKVADTAATNERSFLLARSMTVEELIALGLLASPSNVCTTALPEFSTRRFPFVRCCYDSNPSKGCQKGHQCYHLHKDPAHQNHKISPLTHGVRKQEIYVQRPHFDAFNEASRTAEIDFESLPCNYGINCKNHKHRECAYRHVFNTAKVSQYDAYIKKFRDHEFQMIGYHNSINKARRDISDEEILRAEQAKMELMAAAAAKARQAPVPQRSENSSSKLPPHRW